MLPSVRLLLNAFAEPVAARANEYITGGWVVTAPKAKAVASTSSCHNLTFLRGFASIFMRKHNVSTSKVRGPMNDRSLQIGVDRVFRDTARRR